MFNSAFQDGSVDFSHIQIVDIFSLLSRKNNITSKR